MQDKNLNAETLTFHNNDYNNDNTITALTLSEHINKNFTISTGGEERIVITEDGKFFVNGKQVSDTNEGREVYEAFVSMLLGGKHK